ncbi:MAG TPA: MarR family transcriptional regulator [Solirubrobacteraceae bacterium]|nr:MarR family transcriptional regulator [Solirubrobacteraceae bacterium]
MAAPDRLDQLVAQWAEQRPDLDTEVMAVVGRVLAVGELVGRRIDRSAARHGLDRGQGDVLFTLRRAGPPYRLSPSRLAASLLVTSGTMTNRLDRLQQRGLIRRAPNPHDRRGMDVELTPEGVALADALVAEHVANEQEMLAPLSPRERDQLVRITRKLYAHLA